VVQPRILQVVAPLVYLLESVGAVTLRMLTNCVRDAVIVLRAARIRSSQLQPYAVPNIGEPSLTAQVFEGAGDSVDQIFLGHGEPVRAF